MKPKNFPGRKRQRQIGALARLERILDKTPSTFHATEATKLKERTKHNLRERRTKKRRA